MYRSDLIDEIADRKNLNYEMVKTVVGALEEVVKDAVARHEKVSIFGFITISVRPRKARMQRNLLTGELWHVPAGHRVHVSPGTKLKAAVKG